MKLNPEQNEALEKVRRKGYAVVVLTLKKRHVLRHRGKDSSYANLIIRVLKADALLTALECEAEADQIGALSLRGQKKYRGFLKEAGVECFEAEHEAFRHAYALLAIYQSQNRKARIAGETDSKHKIYCMRMNESVWENNGFRKFNAMLDQPPLHCYYVGQTRNSVLKRLQEHVDPNHQRNTDWGVNFFPKTNLEEEWMSCRDVVDAFSAASAERPVRKLSRGQALIAEADFCRWLQAEGHAAYFA